MSISILMYDVSGESEYDPRIWTPLMSVLLVVLWFRFGFFD